MNTPTLKIITILDLNLSVTTVLKSFTTICLAVVILPIFSCSSNQKEGNDSSTVIEYEQMVKDSIWYDLYKYYNNTFVRPVTSHSIQSVGEAHNVDFQMLGFFNFIWQNFDLTKFSSNDFLLRYPFANQKLIDNNMETLVDLGLLVREDANYMISKKGVVIGNELMTSIGNEEILDSLLRSSNHKNLIALFEVISSNAMEKEFLGMNTSLQKRREAIPRNGYERSDILRLYFTFGDLVALRNDQSHYRLELLQKVDPTKNHFLLSPAATEIMSYAYEGNFNPAQVMSRSTWGHDLTETREFMNELVNKDLAIWIDDEIELTPQGRKLQLASSEYCEELFYSIWLPMNSSDYDLLRSTIN